MNATKLFVTLHIRNVTQQDDSQQGDLGRYECHAFAVTDSLERKYGFSVNVIKSKYRYVYVGSTILDGIKDGASFCRASDRVHKKIIIVWDLEGKL